MKTNKEYQELLEQYEKLLVKFELIKDGIFTAHEVLTIVKHSAMEDME